MPIGIVCYWPGAELPPGWLWADGQDYYCNSFPDLAAVLYGRKVRFSDKDTFVVPNMGEPGPMGGWVIFARQGVF